MKSHRGVQVSLAAWMLFFLGSWRFHVILIILILLAAKACLALAPACSTWSTDPAARCCLDTSTNGTNGSRDTCGSNRANSHNASSINASFSGAWSKDAICGFQELGIGIFRYFLGGAQGRGWFTNQQWKFGKMMEDDQVSLWETSTTRHGPDCADDSLELWEEL